MRTPSGYLLYAAEKRKMILEKFPELSFGDISKQVGRQVKTMNTVCNHKHFKSSSQVFLKFKFFGTQLNFIPGI